MLFVVVVAAVVVVVVVVVLCSHLHCTVAIRIASDVHRQTHFVRVLYAHPTHERGHDRTHCAPYAQMLYAQYGLPTTELD